MSDEPASLSDLRDEIAELEKECEALVAERDRLAQEAAALASTIDARVRLRRRRGIAIAGAVFALVASGGALAFYLYFESRSVAPAALTGRVVAAQGTSPVNMGERCTIEIAPRFLPDAHVTVTCGGLRLYGHGSFGDVWCERSEGALRCTDGDSIATDGDPQLELDVERASVTVSDGPAWHVIVAIDG